MAEKKKPNPTDVHVGTRVRVRRMVLGITQQKLGGALGLTFQQVQKYEKGANRTGASRLQQIAQILQVPESFFFDGGPNASGKTPKEFSGASSPNYITDFLATPDGFALCKAFMNINDAKLRRRIVDLVEELYKQSK
jgi:transcriptional regulator with XRE-family HTH domain